MRVVSRRLGRRLFLAVPALVAGCATVPVRTNFPPLRYDYLVKLRLNVAAIEFAPLPPPGPLDGLDPAPPGPVLEQMGRERLAAAGTLGRAVFTVQQASIGREGDALVGVFAVRLDVLTSDGTRSGFAEARVTRRLEGVGGDLRGALYDITKQMMDDMNVEFEYQVKQSLRDWLEQAQTAPLPPPVERLPLPAPRS